MSDIRKELGRRGEDIACNYLRRKGFAIIKRNWRCAAGEADIIAREGDELVFIEVKTRSDPNKGLPEDAITPTKRKRYERIALCYLMKESPKSSPVRFDVIAVFYADEGSLLRHHRDAFGFGDR